MPRKGEQGMMWQRVLSPDLGEIDPEHEKELRLVAQARAGAAWALSALVARYQPPVVRYLVRLTGSAERGRSLAEDVLVRMAKRVRGPHGGDYLRLWLLRSATEVGLDALRHPQRADPRRLGESSGPVALIAGRVGDTPVGRWVAGWGTRMRQQAEPRPSVRTQQFIWQESAETPAIEGEEHDQLAPREALKYRMVRAVLAELPYGDAQCLSLHLVAGLNQTEVAQALGIAPAVARRRIVQGLQLFGRRYEAALAGLGLPPDFDAAEGQAAASNVELPAGAPCPDVMPDSGRGPSVDVLDAVVVVEADAGAQPMESAAVARARLPQMELPVVRLAPVAAPQPDEVSPVAPEAADADERALTSAAIMAYLRHAAANARAREQAPAIPSTHAIVEADVMPAATEQTVEHLSPVVTGERYDDNGATSLREPRLIPVFDHAYAIIVEPEPGQKGPSTPADMLDGPGSPPSIIASDEAEDTAIAGETATTDHDGEEVFAASSLDAAPLSVLPAPTSTPPTTILPDDRQETADVMAASASTEEEVSVAIEVEDGTDQPEVMDVAEDADHYMLVVEADSDPPAQEPRISLLRARRTQVLSADGEAEDPTDAAIWPVS